MSPAHENDEKERKSKEITKEMTRKIAEAVEWRVNRKETVIVVWGQSSLLFTASVRGLTNQ